LEFDNTSVTEDELRSFVGANADYYLEKWRPHPGETLIPASRNWAAFLFFGFWLPFRRMYKVTAVLALLVLLENTLEIVFLSIYRVSDTASYGLNSAIGLVFAAICGACANRWYYAHAVKHISRIKLNEPDTEKRAALIAQAGGRSVLSIFGALICFLLVSSALYAVLFRLGFFQNLIFRAPAVPA